MESPGSPSNKDISAWDDEEAEKSSEFRQMFVGLIENCDADQEKYLYSDFAKTALTDPWVPVKYLRAAGADPQIAVDMFMATLKWRQEKRISTILDGAFYPYDEVKPFYPFAWHGHSKFGNTIHYYWAGAVQVEEVAKVCSWDEHIKNHIRRVEYLVRTVQPEDSKKYGHRVHQVTDIVDMWGGGLSQVTQKIYDFLQESIQIDEANYPDILSQLFVINAPWLFTTVWAVIKLFISERNQQKVQIFGEDYMEELLKVIDIDQLPTFIGGECPKNCTRENFWKCDEHERNFRDIVTSGSKDETATQEAPESETQEDPESETQEDPESETREDPESE
eukprot:621763_1